MAGASKPPAGGKIPWPEDMIDARMLFMVIAKELGADNPDPARSHRAYDRALTLEQVVEKARHDGKIKRYVYRDPKTGEPLAYGYKHLDVMTLIGQARKG